MIQLKQTEKQKEEFLTMISHELKTPLTPIVLWSESLLKADMLGTLNDNQKNAVNSIITSAKDLGKIVSDIFDVYKLDLGQLKFHKEILSTQKILNEIIENSSKIASTKNIQLINNSKSNFSVYGDKTRLGQVLRNLINNALDFVPKEKGRIEIKAIEKSYFIEFSVKDNGIGIKPELQRELFKKFYQADSSHTREHGGTGLGLSICKGIVEVLGGKIWVDSEVGKGTTFFFTIPKSRDTLSQFQKKLIN